MSHNHVNSLKCIRTWPTEVIVGENKDKFLYYVESWINYSFLECQYFYKNFCFLKKC